jgi:pimeloyl-ACP methyl ester carboxylesterase
MMLRMRTHVVMVPGFGGFDALGQMHYYTRVTEQLTTWLGNRDDSIELHYFDNLPTAAVLTRARDLREFIEKRVDRRTIQGKDEIVLVGHSTGGLDIRSCLHTLRKDVRARVTRAVFLSVPHWGTNIADFIDQQPSVGLALKVLRDWPRVAGTAIKLARFFKVSPNSQLLYEAIDDIHRDLADQDDGWLAARARRAQGELDGWRGQTAHDFLAIKDLKSRARPTDALCDVDCLSFATIAPNPLRIDNPHDRELRSMLDIVRLIDSEAINRGDTDPIFRLVYTACTAGPFDHVAPAVDWLPGAAGSESSPKTLEPWHNDGIVNTASMVCEVGKTWLVHGDHADIIGHYKAKQAKLVEDSKGLHVRVREHEAYNLLRSNAGFNESSFEAVWNRLFAFAIGGEAAEMPIVKAV